MVVENFKRVSKGTVALRSEGGIFASPPIRATFTVAGEIFAIHRSVLADGTVNPTKGWKVSHIETGFAAASVAHDTIDDAYQKAVENFGRLDPETFRLALARAHEVTK